MDAHLEAVGDGTDVRRRDEECVRNVNAPSCPLLEEGMSATCIGIDRYTDRRHEMSTIVGSRHADSYRWKVPVNSVSRRLGLSLKRSGNACTDLQPIRPGIYSVWTMSEVGTTWQCRCLHEITQQRSTPPVWL